MMTVGMRQIAKGGLAGRTVRCRAVRQLFDIFKEIGI